MSCDTWIVFFVHYYTSALFVSFFKSWLVIILTSAIFFSILWLSLCTYYSDECCAWFYLYGLCPAVRNGQHTKNIIRRIYVSTRNRTTHPDHLSNHWATLTVVELCLKLLPYLGIHVWTRHYCDGNHHRSPTIAILCLGHWSMKCRSRTQTTMWHQ